MGTTQSSTEPELRKQRVPLLFSIWRTSHRWDARCQGCGAGWGTTSFARTGPASISVLAADMQDHEYACTGEDCTDEDARPETEEEHERRTHARFNADRRFGPARSENE